MKLFFLGIGGTLMGNLAILARERGYEVRGADSGIYPPMSDVLADAGIAVQEGWDPAFMNPRPDLVVMGNAGLPRGHPAVEFVLDEGIPFVSGAEWLGRDILRDRWVLAVAGTHGKTTTTSMLAWILRQAGAEPGYLVGGVPVDFERSARLGSGRFFVVEADEYDCSYFDRRSKFVHYHPRTLILNNLEYDHADIFPDLHAIQDQFHNLLRTLPASGRIIAPQDDDALDEVLARGCWTPVDRVASVRPKRGRKPKAHERDTGSVWRAKPHAEHDGRFTIEGAQGAVGQVTWPLLGEHNMVNALAAVAAAAHAGIAPEQAVEALSSFRGVKRRMELVFEGDGIRVYDDFAHHPTAIRTTLQGLRDQVGSEEIVAVIEPRSHTMSLGTLRNELRTCCAAADRAIWFRAEKLNWDLSEVVSASVVPATVAENVDRLVEALVRLTRSRTRGADGRPQPCHIVVMSNGSFGGLPARLKTALGGARDGGSVSVAGRDGERPRARYRSDRIFERDGAWRFATREGAELGPFADRATAEDALASFIRERLAKSALE
ncbi:MAG: UDP-N-acetylmuramate:L-alanyl-gamma-D-glutamyl-meso-diaminopimelate ligase [Pseudomonadales bacterium]|nr:UDP-N-acetylmuramate:L-alanyl-gamma-D-glutamyl-meso-diaminopimelate ligase [Pseudomonadales bacterium]